MEPRADVRIGDTLRRDGAVDGVTFNLEATVG